MKVRNQPFYWAIVTDTDPVNPWTPPRGTFQGGPSGTSQAPHLYLSEAKAKAKCSPWAKVVKVWIEVCQ